MHVRDGGYNPVPVKRLLLFALCGVLSAQSGLIMLGVGGPNPAPTLTSISPSSRSRPPIGSTAYAETLTGTNLTGATAVNVSGSGVTVSNVIVVSDTQITATFTITSSAAQTDRDVSVTTPVGTSNTVTFTVT